MGYNPNIPNIYIYMIIYVPDAPIPSASGFGNGFGCLKTVPNKV